ncbi:MAG: DUF6884 domain-containing protein [Anaerolineaceae bacterium]
MKKIVLISCVKSKRKVPDIAQNLYISPLFCLNLKYANQLYPDKIFILSAKYGLVDLNQVISPYDKTLNKMSESERKGWAQGILNSLGERTDLESDAFIILAGINYRKYIIPKLNHYEIPLEGLSFGKQLQELNKRIS